MAVSSPNEEVRFWPIEAPYPTTHRATDPNTTNFAAFLTEGQVLRST